MLRHKVDELELNVLHLDRGSTSKFPHMVIWQMCSPFDLDITLLGVYPKQTGRLQRRVGVQVHAGGPTRILWAACAPGWL